jgi:hypothetical protein
VRERLRERGGGRACVRVSGSVVGGVRACASQGPSGRGNRDAVGWRSVCALEEGLCLWDEDLQLPLDEGDLVLRRVPIV